MAACVVGCLCRRHVVAGRPCPVGCTCGRHSPETRERISQAGLGRFVSLETRAKHRVAMLANSPTRRPEVAIKVSVALSGRSLTDAHKEKIRQARLKQHLPTRLTSIERALRDEFDRRGLAYEMHKTMFGRFQPDFVFEEARLIVQADGDYWHGLPKQLVKDATFNETARANDWKVLRFLGSEIEKDVTSCGQAVTDFNRRAP